jgi:hypothetical protein
MIDGLSIISPPPDAAVSLPFPDPWLAAFATIVVVLRRR